MLKWSGSALYVGFQKKRIAAVAGVDGGTRGTKLGRAVMMLGCWVIHSAPVSAHMPATAAPKGCRLSKKIVKLDEAQIKATHTRHNEGTN